MCRVVKTISEKQKQFEDALLKGLNIYLDAKEYLQNMEGEKYRLGSPAGKELILACRMEFEKVELLFESATNYYPCLQAHVKLILKKEGEANFQENEYYFHVSGDKSAVGGDADYQIFNDNNGLEVVIKHVDYFYKEGNRLF